MRDRRRDESIITIRPVLKKVMAMLIISMLVFAAIPIEANAASSKTKAKYTINVYNINSNTVIKKGKTLKIKGNATRTKGENIKAEKVRFKSSNRRIATVSARGGVIKAKKKGTVKITVYCKSNPKKRKTVKIRIGIPVSKISISGPQYLNVGDSTNLI